MSGPGPPINCRHILSRNPDGYFGSPCRKFSYGCPLGEGGEKTWPSTRSKGPTQSQDWHNLCAEAIASCPSGKEKASVISTSTKAAIHQKVLQLVEEGQYSKAVKTLTSEGIHEVNQDIIDELRAKHPQPHRTRSHRAAARKEKPPNTARPPPPPPPPFTFTQKDIISALRSFPRGIRPPVGPASGHNI